MRFRITGLMLLVAAVGLSLALVQQIVRTQRRVRELEQSLGSPIRMIASYGSSVCRCEAANGKVLIAMGAGAYRSDPGWSVLWSVQIVETSTRRVVYAKRLDERLVRLPAGEHQDLHLATVVDPHLSPGEYQAYVHLVEIPPGADPSGYHPAVRPNPNGALGPFDIVCSGMGRIEIGATSPPSAP